MRVTIAASGQGRFKEELDFARDCSTSGYTPILLVLDPTPSLRLEELVSEYSKYGGRAYIGQDAWEHILAKAGIVMGRFVEGYVRTPLLEINSAYSNLQPINLVVTDTTIAVDIGTETFSITRPASESGLQELEDEYLADN